MKLSFSNYVQMREANIAQTNTVGQVAKGVAGQAAGMVTGLLGIDSIIQAGQIAGQIFNLIKNRQDAGELIQQAMSLPDSTRGGVANAEIFDINDSLWDEKTGILSQLAKNEILQLVQTRLQKIAANPQSVTPENMKGFANNIAIEYIQNKSTNAKKI